MIKKPILYYINKSNKPKEKKNISIHNNKEEEENKIDNKNIIQNNNNPDIILIEKINKKLSKLTYDNQIIYLKEKINEIKTKNGNNSKLLFDIISKLINIQLTQGDLAYNKGDYNLSLEKYKQCLQLNEPLPGSEWPNYMEWYSQRIIIFNSIATVYEKLNKREQAIEYIKLSFNLEDKYNIKSEYKNKFNDIIFLAGRQLLLLGNYKEALKYFFKVEKNIYEQYSIEKILKRKKIDENIDKNFIKDNPDEYIYLLNIIYRCCIKQSNYDLGDKYYQRYEEMYHILNKIKKIKYPFKEADDDNSDIEDIDIGHDKNIFLINNKNIDKAEDDNKLSLTKQKRNKTESKKRINNQKESEDENSINNSDIDNNINSLGPFDDNSNNKKYISNYKELSWGKRKEEKKLTRIMKDNNKDFKNLKDINTRKIPLPKSRKKTIKKSILINKEKKLQTIQNFNINNQKLNTSLDNLSRAKTITEKKSKKNLLKLPSPDEKTATNQKKKIKENLKQTIKEGNYYPPYDFVFKKPEKINNISQNLPKIQINKNDNNINNQNEKQSKNLTVEKLPKKIITEGNELKKVRFNFNNRKNSLLTSLKKRSSSSNIDNIYRFVRIEEKLNLIEKNLKQKKNIFNKEITKLNDEHISFKSNKNLFKGKNSLNINTNNEMNNNEKKDTTKINKFQKNKSLLNLPKLENTNFIKDRSKIKDKTRIENDGIKAIKSLKFPSQKKRKFSNSSKESHNENEEIKSLGSFISFGQKIEKNNDKKEKYKKDDNKEKEKEKEKQKEKLIEKEKIKEKEKEKVEIKSIKQFKPIKLEMSKNNINNKDEEKKIGKRKNENKLNKEAKLRFKTFHELIIKYFRKAKLIISSRKKKFNKYEKIYKRHESNHMILNKIIDNRSYTVTMYLPILNLNENEIKDIEDTDKKEKKVSSNLETQITFRRNDSIFFNKFKINLPIIEENDFYNDELREKIIEVLLNEKIDINFAWIIFLYYFENYFSIYKQDLENRAKNIIHTNEQLIDENNISKNIFMKKKNENENDFINIQKDYIYYYINIINKHLYNNTQWKNKKILVGNNKNESNVFFNLYYNILHNYINIFADFLYLENTLVNKKVCIRNLEIESIKSRNKIVLDSVQNILNYSYDFKQLSQRLLLKKLLYNSFINTDLLNIVVSKQPYEDENNSKKDNIYVKKENQNLPLLDTINLIQKYKNIDFEQYFYDNQIIYKGMIKMEKYDYMHLTISIRSFEKIILHEAEYKIIDYNIIDLRLKNTKVNFDNLNFLSTDKDIVKLYPKINIDFSKKFYDTTKYKTFLQLTLVNLNPNSKWYDITYVPWEMYNYFISLFEEPNNKIFFLNNPFTMEEIAKNQMMNSQLGVFFCYFLSNFCDFENGSLNIKNTLYNKDLYWKYFISLYNTYDDYIYGLMIRQKYINRNVVEIPINIVHFYKNFLSKMHNFYYKIYFKENKYYLPERIDTNKDSDDEDDEIKYVNKSKKKHAIQKNNLREKDDNIKNLYIIRKGYKDNYKSIFEKEEGNLVMSFNIFLKLGKNRYNAIFKFLKNRIHLTNDPNNIKNYLLPTDSLPKVFVQLRSILSNELIHTNIYNINLINNIKYMFDNNTNEKLLKTYFENLIHIADLPYGKKIIFDFLFNTFTLKSKTKNNYNTNNLNLLNKISIILLHESNYNSSQMPENIFCVKTYKTMFINTKKQQKVLFNFRVYGDGQKTIKKNISKNKEKEKESLYNKLFGTIKTSKLSEKIEKKYPEINDNTIDNYKIMHYYYLIDAYYPKTSIKSIFILSTYDLQIILKKIKNKNIRAEYLTTVDNFIKLLPKKISLQNTQVDKKVYINFSKYKDLRTDWEKQLSNKNLKNKLLLEKRINNVVDKKSELKIFLKQNFVNLRSKESLYDISTDEMILTIKKVKIYKINNKKLSCIVTIYYHRILDYWQIFLFFPFSSRRFTTILEPKHMENIVTNETLSQINKKIIKDKEIFEFIVNESKITYNFEEIGYFELLNMKLLLKEILYYGYELINDGLQSGLNKIIYIEITIKALNLFTLDKIDKIIDKVEIDQCFLIFQSFSFHELYWHKENFKLEDLEPYYSNKIILEKKIDKKNNEKEKNNSIIENNALSEKKLLPYYYLRKLIVHIIQPYVNSQQHIFEKQMKLFKNKNIIGGNIQNLIDSTKYDRANQQKIANLYQQKLDNKIIFNKIYTETIRQDPPVIASVGINLVKERIFITLYYPFKSKSYDIEIDFETVKNTFFPYFLDILSIDKISLGKRILRRYQNFITKTPHFLKLLKASK